MLNVEQPTKQKRHYAATSKDKLGPGALKPFISGIARKIHPVQKPPRDCAARLSRVWADKVSTAVGKHRRPLHKWEMGGIAD
ncbi:hypothetical protein CKAH01_04596 [Colletotrichum kahawae]|uniref:Uncharacterized protein n=1 Tax=Colletotrichum kahawae TaxID=34407 RepID=A0AAE0DAT3_COLKA|nr:hypothetical protein CKAH01_04596 [Colletotrichum kahawae]